MQHISHTIEPSRRDVFIAVARPAVVLAVLAAGWFLWLAWSPAPLPGPGHDFDVTLLAYKSQSARFQPPADILLAGDSSCLMNVSSLELDRTLEGASKTLNLGTLSYLSIEDHRHLIDRALRERISPPAVIILLLHPQSLRASSASEFHRSTLDRFLGINAAGGEAARAGWPPPPPSLALAMARERLVPWIVPVALPGRYGPFYGFTSDLWNFLEINRGSAVEPGVLQAGPLPGDPTFRVAPGAHSQSRGFKQTLPPSTLLVAGLTPLPETFALPDHAERQASLLKDWNVSLGADLLLTNMPATLPNRYFATQTHLNANGQALYSRTLALILKNQGLTTRLGVGTSR